MRYFNIGVIVGVGVYGQAPGRAREKRGGGYGKGGGCMLYISKELQCLHIEWGNGGGCFLCCLFMFFPQEGMLRLVYGQDTWTQGKWPRNPSSIEHT